MRAELSFSTPRPRSRRLRPYRAIVAVVDCVAGGNGRYVLPAPGGRQCRRRRCSLGKVHACAGCSIRRPAWSAIGRRSCPVSLPRRGDSSHVARAALPRGFAVQRGKQFALESYARIRPGRGRLRAAGYLAWLRTVRSSRRMPRIPTTDKERRIAALDAVLTQYGSP